MKKSIAVKSADYANQDFQAFPCKLLQRSILSKYCRAIIAQWLEHQISEQLGIQASLISSA